MNKYLVEIFWSDDDAGYIAVVPDLPGCSAFGETLEEAAHEIKDAQMPGWRLAEHQGILLQLPLRKLEKQHD